MLSKFFIERPIFANVLAIIVMAFGIFSVMNLPVERYPDIAPPKITVSANYSGADAQTVEQSVTQILEQQIQGIDHLLYLVHQVIHRDVAELPLVLIMEPTQTLLRSKSKTVLAVSYAVYPMKFSAKV